MIPAIIFICLLIGLSVWGAYILFKPPKNCCILVGVKEGDPELELNLQRAATLAGNALPIFIVENCSGQNSQSICGIFCRDKNAQIISIEELPEKVKEYLQS